MGWSGYGHAAWMFLGPLMLLVFMIVCVAAVSAVLRRRALDRELGSSPGKQDRGA